jgi:ATP-dependent DNA ligase
MTETFPILYKRNNKNKISQWQIQIGKVDEFYVITTTFGEKDGKQQVETRNIVNGKANRTPLQQANLEATSKWKEKTQRNTYSQFIETSINIRPMLANTFQKELYHENYTGRTYTLPFPLYLQRKFDGIRCLTHMNNDDNISMESRKGIVFEKFENIKDEIRLLYSTCSKDVYFDGELYTDSLNFETISGLVRSSNNSNINDINKIQYHIYDIYDHSKPLWKYHERKEFLILISKLYRFENIIFVETDIAKNMNDVQYYHKRYVKEGFEGTILRDTNGPYEQNKRSKFLQKYKDFMEDEFEIVGFHDGNGHDKELVIWECVTKCGKTFSAKPSGSFEDRKLMFQEASQYIGKQLTVVFQEYSTDGVPRFPVGKGIRDDL